MPLLEQTLFISTRFLLHATRIRNDKTDRRCSHVLSRADARVDTFDT